MPSATLPLPAARPSRLTDRGTVFLLAMFCCLLWGSSYPAIKGGYALFAIAADDVASKLVFAGWRFALAGGLLLGWAAATGKRVGGWSPRAMGQMALLGLLQTTLQYVFFYIGLANTTGVKSSIMNATGTFFSVLLAHFIYHNDRLDRRKTLGCLVGCLMGCHLLGRRRAALSTVGNRRRIGQVTLAALQIK